MNYINKTILITGGTGYIGSALVDKFNSIDCNLIISKGDVSKKTTWNDIITDKIDFIFHLAARELSFDKDVERDLNVNAVSILHMLQTCVEKNYNPRIIFSSSTNIFGNAECDVVNEDIKANPPAEWSAHKLLAENYLRMYSSRFGLNTVILRLPNVYGPISNKDTMSRMVINKVIQYGIENKKIKLYKNKDCYRDYIFVDDVVDAFLKVGMGNDEIFDGRFFVVGSDKLVTISDVWNIIADSIGDVSISIDNEIELGLIEKRSFVGDYKRLRETTNWKPEINLEKGIEITIEDLK